MLHQLHTCNYLNDMRFESVRRELNYSDMEELETIYQRILSLTPQARKRYNIEDAKVDILYDATEGHTWSKTALANLMAQSQSSGEDWSLDQYQQHLTAQLAAASERAPGADLHDISECNQPKNTSTPPPGIPTYLSHPAVSSHPTHTYYGAQYAQNPKHIRTPQKSQRNHPNALDVADMLGVNLPGGPSNLIKRKFSPQELRSIKKPTRCLNCKKTWPLAKGMSGKNLNNYAFQIDG